MPANTLAPTTSPTKPGWHLVDFLDGSAAIVRWDNQLGVAGPAHAWQWGSVTPPHSPITGFSYLGSTVQDVVSHPSRLTSAMKSLPAAVQASIAHGADTGVFALKGQPMLFTPAGKTQQNAPGSSANPTNIIPSPINPNVGNSNIGSLTGIWSSIQADAKYAGLMVAVLLVGAVLMFHAFSSSGAGGKTRIVPVP